MDDIYTIITLVDISRTIAPCLLLRDTGDMKEWGSKSRKGCYCNRENISILFKEGVQHNLNRCGDAYNQGIMFTLIFSKIPTEPTSLFDDNIKELLYDIKKNFIRTMKVTITSNDKISNVKGTESYLDKGFGY